MTYSQSVNTRICRAPLNDTSRSANNRQDNYDCRRFYKFVLDLRQICAVRNVGETKATGVENRVKTMHFLHDRCKI